jgi:lipopolysaccharide biosynthesis glycosyltransferase
MAETTPRATESLRLVSAIDHNYVIPWSAMIASLRDHNGGVPIDAYVLQYDLTPDDRVYLERIAAAHSLSLHVIEISPYPFNLFHTRKRDNYVRGRATMPPIAYAKAFVDRFLPQEIDRVVTIDADIIVSDRIAGLSSMELAKPLAAVANVTRPYSPIFNSGFMLVNLREWRERRVSDIACRFLMEHSRALHTHDQQVLNLIFGGNWLRLSPRWNYMEDFYRFRDGPSPYTVEEVEEARKHPIVIHYKNSAEKPWRKDSTHPRAALYAQYVDTTRRHRAGLSLFDPGEGNA